MKGKRREYSPCHDTICKCPECTRVRDWNRKIELGQMKDEKLRGVIKEVILAVYGGNEGESEIIDFASTAIHKLFREKLPESPYDPCNGQHTGERIGFNRAIADTIKSQEEI